MKFDRITPRSALVLAGALGIYGLLTVGVAFAAYAEGGSATAQLALAAAGSVSVPVTALVTLLVACWQAAEADAGPAVRSDPPSDPVAPRVEPGVADAARRPPLVDRSIIIVGNGHERLELRRSGDDFAFEGGPSCAAPRTAPSSRAEAPGRE